MNSRVHGWWTLSARDRNDPTRFSKAPWCDAGTDPNEAVHNIFGDRDPKRHEQNRRKIAALYSMSNMLRYEPCLAECINVLVAKLDHFSRTGETINLQHWLHFYAFDLIGLITVSGYEYFMLSRISVNTTSMKCTRPDSDLPFALLARKDFRSRRNLTRQGWVFESST